MKKEGTMKIRRRSPMTISLVQVRLLGFLGGAIMMMAAVPDSHATRAPIIACSSLTAFTSLTIPKVVITSAVLNAATQSLPEHCLINGKINERVGVGGQIYAIKFRVRMPTAWNERLYMGGGG